ncbi:MAG: hypothetical protein ACRC0J_15210 [Shewanella oncorhynchi]
MTSFESKALVPVTNVTSTAIGAPQIFILAVNDNERARVTSATATRYAGANGTEISVHIVPLAGTASLSNLIARKTVSGGIGSTVFFPELADKYLDTGQSLQVYSGLANAYNFSVSGDLISLNSD